MTANPETSLDPAGWIKTYVTVGMEKTWEHDRISTIGASEVFACLRRVTADKLEWPHDPDYSSSRGAMRRGDIIENEVFVPAMQAGTATIGSTLTRAGTKQQTIVDGYLSATPDGLVTGLRRDCLAHLGVPDIGSDCVVTECKSYDPRVSITSPKEEHQGQTIVQMGLIRHATRHRPNFAIVAYVNASFLDDVEQFVVPYDQGIYDAAYARTIKIMGTDDPWTMPPEGKIAGGKECDYCPIAGQCAAQLAGRVPGTEAAAFAFETADAVQLETLVVEHRRAKLAETTALRQAAEADEKIKAILRKADRRKAAGAGWTISYYSMPGRASLDRDALTKAGVDLSDFEKAGKPSEVLRVNFTK